MCGSPLAAVHEISERRQDCDLVHTKSSVPPPEVFPPPAPARSPELCEDDTVRSARSTVDPKQKQSKAQTPERTPRWINGVAYVVAGWIVIVGLAEGYGLLVIAITATAMFYLTI
jgi:hypothetical protein